MIAADRCQRWTERRAIYRKPGEQIDAAAYDVTPIAADRTAKAFVERHHYSGTYPAARFKFGLHLRGELVGVAVFSHPCHNAVITNTFPGFGPRDGVELGRFVLLDQVPGNGETWFLARCFELLRGKVAGVVSFSDPVPRPRLDGVLVSPGHYGTIYQAANGRFLGRGRGGPLLLLPDGRAIHRRSMTKIVSGVRGSRPAIRALVVAGADPLPDLCSKADRAAWLAEWLPRLTRSFKHPGNYRYAWTLERRDRRVLAAAVGPYPKRETAQNENRVEYARSAA